MGFDETVKHKPMDDGERERVQQAGGFVIFGRVGGTLAVSRAFGDKPFKVPHSKVTCCVVILLLSFFCLCTCVCVCLYI